MYKKKLSMLAKNAICCIYNEEKKILLEKNKLKMFFLQLFINEQI